MSASPSPFDPRAATPEQLEAWLDGELPATEAALLDELAAVDPSLRTRRADHARLAGLLREEFAAPAEIPYPDFFMHRLERQLEAAREELAPAPDAAPAAAARVRQPARWLAWLPWGLTAATAAALVLTLNRSPEAAANAAPVVVDTTAPSSANLTLLTAYSPRAQIRSSPEESQGAVLLVLDGLPEYQGDIRGTGKRLSQRDRPDSTSAETQVALAGSPAGKS